MAAVEGLLDPERVSLLYTGRFGSYGRDPGPLAEALGRFAATAPEEAAKLELAVAGPLTPDERALLEGTGAGVVKVSLLGSLERERSLALQRRADALLLLAQPARSQLVNFKLFEYLASGRRSSLSPTAPRPAASPPTPASPSSAPTTRRRSPRRSAPSSAAISRPGPWREWPLRLPRRRRGDVAGPARRLAAQRGFGAIGRSSAPNVVFHPL